MRNVLATVAVTAVALAWPGVAGAAEGARADFVLLVRDGLSSKIDQGQSVSFHTSMGPTRVRASVVSCDHDGLTARVRGSNLQLTWRQMSVKDLLSLGSHVLPPGGATHLLRARVCLDAGLEAEAVAEFERLPAFGWDIPPDGAQLIDKCAEARRARAAKRTAAASRPNNGRRGAKKKRPRRLPTLAELVDSIGASLKAGGPSAAAARDLINRTRGGLDRPITRRAKTFDELKKYRLGPDGRANALDSEMRTIFGLAMSDQTTNGRMARSLPVLALCYRVTGEDRFRDKLTKQLDEMATWSPLQRPGWTCYKRGRRLPPDGKDGSWLSTGLGVRAIADALEILPPGALDSGLVERLHELLAAEVEMIVDDWKSKRQWFVRGNNAITNQWVLPTEGLVRACIVLGVDEHKDAYELGVKNMLQAFDAHGKDGEFEEGFTYASGWTLPSMLSAARAMGAHGDTRCIEHPYLRRFPVWLAHHYQPGKRMINCFDAHGAAGQGYGGNRAFLSMLSVCTQDTVARWALLHQVGGPSNDLFGILARRLAPVGPSAAPVPYAAYERATRVNWRSSWADDAVGVWVRGGHATDQHDDADRGHVNFIAYGTPILIEAGTPAYHNPLKGSKYSSGVGHNVLQIGDAGLPSRDVAPITVKKLDESGGDIVVEAGACYDGAKSWRRRVTWTAAEVKVTDTVVLSRKDRVLFRWHLGTEERARIEDKGKDGFTVTWTDAVMTIKASAPVKVTTTKLPDHTITRRGWPSGKDVDHLHTCVVVESAAAVAAFETVMSVRPIPASSVHWCPRTTSATSRPWVRASRMYSGITHSSTSPQTSTSTSCSRASCTCRRPPGAPTRIPTFVIRRSRSPITSAPRCRACRRRRRSGRPGARASGPRRPSSRRGRWCSRRTTGRSNMAPSRCAQRTRITSTSSNHTRAFRVVVQTPIETRRRSSVTSNRSLNCCHSSDTEWGASSASPCRASTMAFSSMSAQAQYRSS